MSGKPDPTSPRGCLRHGGGPLLVLWGLAWIGGGTWQLLAPPARQRVPADVAWMVLASGVVLTSIGVRMVRRVLRGGVRGAPRSSGDVSFTDVALADGRSATVRLTDGALVVETLAVRPWSLALGAVGIGAYVTFALSTIAAGGGGPGFSGRMWFVLALAGITNSFQRKQAARYPLDAFGAVAVDDRVVTLHRRGGVRPPLALAAKSWHVGRLADALRERIPDAFESDVPAAAPAGRDEAAEMGRAVAEWVPEGRRALSTALGAGFVAVSLLLGAFESAGVLSRPVVQPLWLSVAALVVWLEDAASSRLRRREADRVHGKAERPLSVHTRRPRGDVIAWLSPWRRTTLHEQQGRLVLLHEQRDVLDAGVMAGVACLGGWLVLGGLTPWYAIAYLALLLASGYPRRRREPELFAPEDVLALNDHGSRATLTVQGDEGPLEVVLRYDSGQGPRIASLIRDLSPDAEIREPGWRR